MIFLFVCFFRLKAFIKVSTKYNILPCDWHFEKKLYVFLRGIYYCIFVFYYCKNYCSTVLKFDFNSLFSFLLCLSECKIENCEACFNRNFCTKCKEGFYSHSGRCYVSCAPDQSAINETMECVGEYHVCFNVTFPCQSNAEAAQNYEPYVNWLLVEWKLVEYNFGWKKKKTLEMPGCSFCLVIIFFHIYFLQLYVSLCYNPGDWPIVVIWECSFYACFLSYFCPWIQQHRDFFL